jgi:hypothetical protein
MMRSHLKSIVCIASLIACPIVALARDRSDEPTVIGETQSASASLPTQPIPFSYEVNPDGSLKVQPAAMITYVKQQTEIKLAAAAEVRRSTVLVVEAREQVEANTEEIKLANVQREIDVQNLKEVYASLERMYQDWQITKENLLRTEQNLAATRGELMTTRQHLGATQGQLQGAMGSLNQANQMMDKMRARAWIPAPISTVLNLISPI